MAYQNIGMFHNPRDSSPEIARIKLEVSMQGRENKFKALFKEYKYVCKEEMEGKWAPGENQKGGSITAL